MAEATKMLIDLRLVEVIDKESNKFRSMEGFMLNFLQPIGTERQEQQAIKIFLTLD